MYSTTKAGVVAFTQTLRVRVANMFEFTHCISELQRLAKTDGVRVNCVCPTWINTDMGKMAMFDTDDKTKEMVKRATLLR